MSKGIENCSVLVCFLTPAYQNSPNCKREQNYALQINIPIIPCIIGTEEEGIRWKATGWLSMSISSILYLDFTDLENNDAKFQIQCQELLRRIDAEILT
jgi:hypothetical protein